MANVILRAAEARTLLGDPALAAVLIEIEEAAKADFLASGGDPEAMTAAYRKVEAVQTLRNALQARITDEGFANRQEQRRE